MIPILYNYNEQAFKSNGLGRLTDCLTCEVTEERNGIYECDFTYPVGGALFDELKRGMILGVTHDDTGDIQPFAIVSISRPINGVVSFHAVHISYRLGGATGVLSSIASLTDAVIALQPIAQSLGFFIETLKTSTESFPMADGLPHTVREFIGGGEGSILDVYGGELEWDKWVVKLHQSRGKVREFSIRYGVNLADYNETEDWSETYNAVLPYYKKDDTIIVGAVQYVDKSASWTGRTITVPMDVTEYFGDTEPTGPGMVNIIASRIINEKRPDLPLRNITVDFVRLQDFEEFSDIANLYKCSLCDRINVVFPAYKTSGLFQIVKTVWDVLAGRYSSMELGSLQTTLAEALGVGQASGGASGGGGGGGVQSVTVTPALTSGTKVGDIDVDGTTKSLYAPTPPSASSTTPLMDGTASAGSETAYARGNHRHPTDTSRQATLVSGTNIKTINGESVLGSGDLSVGSGIAGGGGIFYGTSETPASTVTKTVACNEFTAEDLTAGTVIFVKFTHNNTASNPRLVINSQAEAAAPIMRYGSTAAGSNTNASWNAGAVVCLIYDGTNWNIEGWLNTTYSGMTDADYQAGTSTTNKLITAARLKAAIGYYAILLSDRYTRSSAGDLSWTSTTEGDSKAIMKSALAFWNGAYSGTSSNLRYSSVGQIIGRNQICYANSRVDTFSGGEISIPFADLGITTGARPVGILLTPEYSSDIVMHYMYDNSSSNVIIRAWKAGAAYSGALRYFAVVFQNTWTGV